MRGRIRSRNPRPKPEIDLAHPRPRTPAISRRPRVGTGRLPAIRRCPVPSDPVVGGMRYEKDLCLLDDTPGLGAEPDPKFLEKCERVTV